jgi:glutamate racemase
VNVIDPAPAIARQTERVLTDRGLCAYRNRVGHHQFFSTETIEKFRFILKTLVDVEDNAYQAQWHEDAPPIRLTAML